MNFQHPGDIERRVHALQKDLLAPGGPQISTVRHYNFAILPYLPEDEFSLRARVARLCGDLRDAGWVTATIALHSLLLKRLRQWEPDFMQALVEREKRLYQKDPERALNYLKEKIVDHVEGPNGLAADIVSEIRQVLNSNPDHGNQIVVFLGRAGALYPFLRTSALLKHIADFTNNIPVVLLYPGKVVGDSGLEFMERLPADRDYRPRIYH